MDPRQQILRILTLCLIFVFILGGVITSTSTNQTITVTPTSATLTAPPVVFPTVPPGGIPIVADYTYLHSTGLLAIPHIVGWDPANQGPDLGPEQRVEPASPAAP